MCLVLDSDCFRHRPQFRRFHRYRRYRPHYVLRRLHLSTGSGALRKFQHAESGRVLIGLAGRIRPYGHTVSCTLAVFIVVHLKIEPDHRPFLRFDLIQADRASTTYPPSITFARKRNYPRPHDRRRNAHC